MTGDSSSPGVDAIPEDEWNREVAEALTRVVASATFARSERSRAFLAYVVTETLAGRGDRLSERTVGRHGLQVGEAFDGGEDASVRVRATRVRKSLHTYYEAEGAGDPIRIDLPPGTYTPTFARVPVPLTPGHGLEPAVLVMLFNPVGEGAGPAATAICEALVGHLVRFPGLRVLGPATSRSVDATEIGRQLGARYVVQGSVVRHGDTMRLSARVNDAATGEVIWAVADTVSQEPADLAGIADGWVAEAAGELGDFAGVLLPRSVGGPGAAGAEGEARLSFYTYILEGTNSSLRDARRVLADAVGGGSQAPDILAMYGNTLAIFAMYGMSEDPEADREEAERLARQSLAGDPHGGAHAHLVLGQVALSRRQWDVAIECARQGARRAAGHPTMLATAGVTLCLAGAWEDGVEVTREALRLNQTHPAYMHGPLAADRVLHGDDAGGLAEAALMTSEDTYHGPFWRAMALAGLGYLERARVEFAVAAKFEPGLAEDPASALTRYGYMRPEHLSLILDRVRLIQESSGR